MGGTINASCGGNKRQETSLFKRQVVTFVSVYRSIQELHSGSGLKKSLFQVSMIPAGTMAGGLLHQRVISALGRPS